MLASADGKNRANASASPTASIAGGCSVGGGAGSGLSPPRIAVRGKPASSFDPALLARLFGDQMQVYRAYWRDDPEFDSSATRRAVPDLASPALDEATIRRLCRFAIDTGFRWPPAASK